MAKPVCEFFEGCPYFKNSLLQEFPIMLEARQEVYCFKDKKSCARYQVRTQLGPGGVPDDLLPSATDRAQRLLAKKGQNTEEDESS